MPLSKLHCLTFVGIRHVRVCIEVHISAGLPSFAIVGLPDTEIRESKERVRSALLNSGFEFPSQRITVNLAPADLPKGTASFDLAVALGIAQASGQLPAKNLDHWLFAGELSLSGELCSTRNPFALAVAARKEAIRHGETLHLMLPQSDAVQTAAVPDIPIYGAKTLFEAASHLVGHGEPLVPNGQKGQQDTPVEPDTLPLDAMLDMQDVVGHEAAKYALLVATAGHHHIRLVGPPGSGKSMLAQRMSGLMPQLPFEEALELAAIKSLKGETQSLSMRRPYRNPHASTSLPALIGGGNPPSPGEITLAHQGILFTDEVLEFDRRTLESLREPLETGRVNISRSGHQATFPARFLWICAHNPCPCGWFGHMVKPCRCTPEQIRRYQGKLSGPLADRLDISVEINPVDHRALISVNTEFHVQPESSSSMRDKVGKARDIQLKRQGCLNGELPAGQIQRYCKPAVDAEKLLLSYAHKNHLSSRAVHRICRVARTLADLDGKAEIERKHVATAIQYRKSLNELHSVATSPIVNKSNSELVE
ncbi:MAG: YifB family Mg chelatase-like AAA ATPase [Limnobacter sp.]|nr:YifB family Mg chelatase-like AAA ATPase [Limnobacter sp.]